MFDAPKETARERAARIWRNNQIQQKIQELDEIIEEPLTITDEQLDQITARFRREMRKIIKQRTHKSLLHYLIMKRLKRIKTDDI
jgi:hexokinase